MKVPVYNTAGKKVGSATLPASIFEAKVNRGLMHQALVRQLANARLGTHSTKGRSDVSRTTAKAYRQKGTGRARHGSRRAPIFVGGGVAHGPKPRSYRKQMPRKMRRMALRSALSARAKEGDVVVVDELALTTAKTGEVAAVLERLVNSDSALLLLSDRDGDVARTARNIRDVKTLKANYLNIRDLLGYDRIVMPLAALEVINDFLGDETDLSLLMDEEE